MEPGPLSPLDPSAQQRLAAARGELRDAVGSLLNLQRLLGSIRVGPRAVSSVLPAVHASCGAIARATQTLLDAIAPRLPEREPATLLMAFVNPRVQELDRALARAIRRPMYAKNRLELESAVSRVATELDAARALVDLLDEAVFGRAVRVALRDLVHETSVKDARGGDNVVDVTFASGSGTELLVNTRVAPALLSIGVGLVRERHPDRAPHIESETTADAGQLRISADGGGGDKLAISTPALIEPTLACARAAASSSGCSFAWDASAARVVLGWKNGMS